MNSPIRVIRGQFIREAVAALLFACLLLPDIQAAAPAWWTTQQVLAPGKQADDYAVANLGQLKNMAKKAAQEMNNVLPGGAGTEINSLIATWEAPPAPGVTRDDYTALNLGQLKNVAKKFHDRLAAIGVRPAGIYPWSQSSHAADDHAVANLGQLKAVFSFAISDGDDDNDGIPDAWEMQIFGNLNQNAADDPDHDDLDNLHEFQAGTRPTDADSDDDGYNDGEESSEGTNPNSLASHPIDAIPALAADPEVLPWAPYPSLVGFYKGVINHWDDFDGYDFQTGQPTRVQNGTLRWTESGGSWIDDPPYFSFEPRWQAKLASLHFPTGEMNGGTNFSANAYHRLTTTSNPYHQSGWVNLWHTKVGLRPYYAVPWELGRRYLRCKSSMPDDHEELRQVDGVEMPLLKVPSSSIETPNANRIGLEPVVTENVWRDDELYDLYAYSIDWSKSVAVDDVTYDSVNGPQRWLMVPQGEDSAQVLLAAQTQYGKCCGVFKIEGAVTADTPYPLQGSSGMMTSNIYTFTGAQEGDGAYMKVGAAPRYSSPATDAKYAATPFLRFAVYSKKKLKVNVIPIALQGVAGATPQNIPDPQLLQDYLNSVFKVQANIEVSVTVVPTATSVAYDIGLGQLGMEKRGDGNGTLDVLWSPVGAANSTKYSAEESAIVNATANQRVNEAINVYLVAGKPQGLYFTPLVVHGWDPQNKDTHSYGGFAGSSDNQPNVRATWVMDLTNQLPAVWLDSIHHLIAHEIGHVLGLYHSNDTNWNINSDIELRLMTGRFGDKHNTLPKRLIKQEWDSIRTYDGFGGTGQP